MMAAYRLQCFYEGQTFCFVAVGHSPEDQQHAGAHASCILLPLLIGLQQRPQCVQLRQRTCVVITCSGPMRLTGGGGVL